MAKASMNSSLGPDEIERASIIEKLLKFLNDLFPTFLIEFRNGFDSTHYNRQRCKYCIAGWMIS